MEDDTHAQCNPAGTVRAHAHARVYCAFNRDPPCRVVNITGMNSGCRKRRRALRYVCSFCHYSLQHTAYRRHQLLPHVYCPARNKENDSTSGSDSTFEFSETVDSMNTDSVSCPEPESEPNDLDSHSPAISDSSNLSDESCNESATEVWEGEFSASESESSESQEGTHTQLHFMISIFLSFFQLCFRISDRAIVHLLSFMSALFHFLSSHSNDSGLLKKFTDGFPKTLYSIKKALNLSNTYYEYVVCPHCHTLYNKSDCIVQLPVGERGLKCDFVRYPNHPQRARRKKCETELMKKVKVGQKYKLVPRKTYVYYSIIESLKKLIKTPGFLDKCEEWRNRDPPSKWLADVYDGKLWKEWMKYGGIPYLEVPGNLILMMNIDWFQPFDHIQYSVGVIYLVIQNLPRSLRFKPENIIIVSTIPGPKEPSYANLNPYLTCVVNHLLNLWEGVEMQVPSTILSTRLIRAALVYISSDLPATRKLCGFYGVNALHGYSKCLKTFPSINLQTDYSGFDRARWPPRNLSDHLEQAHRAKAAATRSAQEIIERQYGVRYSELLKLPYFNVVRYHLVDPMHNLFLGTAKRLLTLWKDKGYLNNLEDIQKEVDNILPPGNVGRIPHKIAAGFSGFTAEQWMLWTVLYSPLVLRNKIPQELYDHWIIFSQACSLLCSPSIHIDEVDKADELLLTFCTRHQELYGPQSCTPNMHMHCHLKHCINDVGPLHSFWCFSFERYNGILEKMQKTWQSPEIQLVHKFSKLQTLSSFDLPQGIPKELQDCFSQMKLSLPDSVLDGLAVMKYEQNMLCLVSDICSSKLPHHRPIPPGHEKYMREEVRDTLSEMYAAIYGFENVVHVPLQYTEFHDVQVFDKTYISVKSRSTKSPAVLAAWASPSGIITDRVPCCDDIRVGIIKYFLLHSAKVKSEDRTNVEKIHVLACIDWSEDHPHKFLFGNGIIIGATVCQAFSSASFMPVSRIITQCAIVDRKMCMDYGEDSVRIALPLKKHSILFNQ